MSSDHNPQRVRRQLSDEASAYVRALIMSGEIPLGSKLPTTAEFIERYRISNVTVQRALVILKSEGLAIGRTGAGVYVTSPTYRSPVRVSLAKASGSNGWP